MQKNTFEYTFISCVKTKLSHTALAKDLYISPLFKKAWAYAIANTEGGEKNIYILSAKYGLIPCDMQIAPYEQTLNKKNKIECKLWAAHILKTMTQYNIPKTARIQILAGRNYREYIMQKLPNSYCPIKGLSMGNILKFYNTKL